MKRLLPVFLGIAMSFWASTALAGEMPDAPEKSEITKSPPAIRPMRPGLLQRSWVDYSLWVSVVGVHTADWITTEKCVHVSQVQEAAGYLGICHESFLPQDLVENKAGFAAYEAATAGAEIYAQYLLEKHHHVRIARVAQLANIVASGFVVAHNYHAAETAAHGY
jgi:hypothetical protein